MGEKMKKSFLKAIALVGKMSAEVGHNSASIFGYHQPKEPQSFNKETNNK